MYKAEVNNMEKFYFVVSSVTYAMKAQRLLSSAGIKSEIKRSTRRSTEKSCSYTVGVAAAKAAQAERILAQHSVKILGRKDGD